MDYFITFAIGIIMSAISVFGIMKSNEIFLGRSQNMLRYKITNGQEEWATYCDKPVYKDEK